MESAESKANNAFLNYLMDAFCIKTTTEDTNAFATIDGDFISEGAMNKALKAGKGLLIGGFFVGSVNNDINYSYSL